LSCEPPLRPTLYVDWVLQAGYMVAVQATQLQAS
jgi:hypothetical protein